MGNNVSIPSGDLYPNGITVIPPNADIQATVRPAGTKFVKSPGFETIRPGKTKFQKGLHGLGIHFTPRRFAENVDNRNKLPLMVDATTSADHADIADLPGSEDLEPGGMLAPEVAESGGGVKISESSLAAPVGGKALHSGKNTFADMGDREPGRPISRLFNNALHNPAGLFRQEYQKDPVVAVGAAAIIVGGVYFLVRELEGNYSRRRRGSSGGSVSSAVAPAGASAAAVTDTAGSAVRESAEVANDAATAAGKAAEKAASAAGDVAEAAGEAVQEVTESVGDAVT